MKRRETVAIGKAGSAAEREAMDRMCLELSRLLRRMRAAEGEEEMLGLADAMAEAVKAGLGPLIEEASWRPIAWAAVELEWRAEEEARP